MRPKLVAGSWKLAAEPGTQIALVPSVMIRMEQVRGEMLERFERVDRRFAQNELRLGRIEQRLADVVDLVEGLRAELLAQLELLAWSPAGRAVLAEPASQYVLELAPDDYE